MRVVCEMPPQLLKPRFGWENGYLFIPAGERWEDNSLRPSLEDWIGAGEIINQLSGSLSPEAQAALDVYRAAGADLSQTIRNCSSGVELVERGYETDVALASEVDVSCSVPHTS